MLQSSPGKLAQTKSVMSVPNGLLSPPSPSKSKQSPIVSPGKRKREKSVEQTLSKDGIASQDRAKFEGLMRDLLDVLKRQDTTPSILNHKLPKDQSEPTAKRQKISEPDSSASISSKLDSGSYMTWNELVADVETVSSTILAELHSKNGLPNGSISYRSCASHPEDEKVAASLLAFTKTINILMLRESIQKSQNITATPKKDDLAEMESTVVANGTGGKNTSSALQGDIRSNRLVLTLYGNTQSQPKQLFSSLQEPTRVIPADAKYRACQCTDSSASTSSSHSAILPTAEVFAPLREAALPTGISTTQIIPVHSITTSDNKKRVPTLGDIFAPPATLPQLAPPKPSKYTTTRSSSVGWFNPSEPNPSTPNTSLGAGVYTMQPLSTGQWLSYNAIPPPQSPSEIRRSRRDRSSSDAARAQINLEAIAKHSRAKEEALFRSAYSSFAPTHDDSGAIVSQELKNRIWWERVGSKRFEQLLADPFTGEFNDHGSPDTGEAAMALQDEDELLREAVESWVPEDPPFDFKANEASKRPQTFEDTQLDDILKDISELLETLNSYQRIRNLSLAPMSQTAVGQNRQITAMTGCPSSPSSAEVDTYNILKSQLSILIATLPPYAVAKLNGEQLAELNVSTKLVIEGKDYKGVMEEDETAARAAALALTAAAGATTRINAPAVPQYPAQGQYSASRTPAVQYHQRSASNTPLSTPRPQQVTHQHFHQQQQQQTPVRPSSSAPQQNPVPGSQSSFQQPQRSSSASVHRLPSGVSAPQSYGQQTSRPPQPHYGQSNPQQYFQQGTPQAYQQYHNHSQSSAPSPTTSRLFQQAPPTQYQQQPTHRPQFAPTLGQYSGTPSGLPAKSQQPQSAIQHRPNPSSLQTPVRQTQYFQQSPQNQFQTPSTLGASGFHTYMSAEQQASLMERQRAQLAQQNQLTQQNRAAAQANMQRPAQNMALPQGNLAQGVQQTTQQQEYGGSVSQGYGNSQITNSLNPQHGPNTGSTVTAGNGR